MSRNKNKKNRTAGAIASAARKRKNNKSKTKAEVTRLGAVLRSLGGLGGGAVGSLLGHPAAGAQVGNSLGAAVSKWLGSGDYSVSQNSIVRTAVMAPDVPLMHKNDQSIVVRNREFLGTITGSSAFSISASYPLNPGMSQTFPWLSTIANRFQEYSFKGIVFHYVPTSGDAISSTSAALGSVMMQTSYRATDTPPTSKAEMLNEYWACESVPSEALCHPIECNPKENPFNVQYVRSRGLGATESQLMYDLGVMTIATNGQQSTSPIGDLWITYEVELKKPQLVSPVTSPLSIFTASWSGPFTFPDYFSGVPIATGGTMSATAANRQLTLPSGLRGTYLVTVSFFGSPFGAYTPGSGSVTYLTNCAAASIYPGVGNTKVESSFTASAGPTSLTLLYGVTQTDPSQPSVMQFSIQALTNGPVTYVGLAVTQIG